MSGPPALESEFGSPAKRAISPTQHRTWQSRMATLMKQAEHGVQFQPHSPPSSPPKTPQSNNPVVDWDQMDSEISKVGLIIIIGP